MRYKIRDNQFDCRYFADEELFDDFEEIRQQLCDYHSVDYEGEERDIEDFTLAEILDYGEWSIEDEDGNEIDIFTRCWHCGELLKEGEPRHPRENAWFADLYCDKCFGLQKDNS